MSCLYTLYDYLCSFSAIPGARSETLRLGERRLKTIRLLGEGGFSYVYLVQDLTTRQEYALKKIRCPFGEESVKTALNEVEAHRLFKHETIIEAVDHAIVQDMDGSKVVYILLPYYKQGNLQDLINESKIHGKSLKETLILQYLVDICEALQKLHNYQAPVENESDERSSNDGEDSHKPLLHSDESSGLHLSTNARGTNVPYAHYDLKPANIMLTDNGRLVLMDFGSCKPARRYISNRAEGLQVQDMAAEVCTMPYRAPELFDCKTNSIIDEKVDIWSLGCVLFALLYGHSPFETSQTESGSIALAVLNCQYHLPNDPQTVVTQALQGLIRQCLRLDAGKRPSAADLLASATNLIASPG